MVMRRAALSQPALHPLGAPSRECLDWAVFSPGGPRLVVEETLSLCCLSDLDPPLRARPSPRGAAVLGRSFVTMTRTARLRCVATPSRPGTVGKECTQYRITLPPGRGGVWHSPFVPVAAYSLAAQLKLYVVTRDTGIPPPPVEEQSPFRTLPSSYSSVSRITAVRTV